MKQYRNRGSYISLTWFVFFVAVTFLHSPEVNAQEYTYGYEFKPKRNRVSIPFEWQNDLMVVKVRINTSDTLNFILDSGAGMNLLLDPEVAASLDLNYVRKINLIGHGMGESLTAMVAINNHIYMDGVRAMGQSVVTLSKDVLDISNSVNAPIHGVFGYDIFRSFVVELDFSKRLISLYNPQKFKYRKSMGKKIPLSVESGKPYMIALASMPNGTEVPVKLILDTGSGNGLSLERVGNPDVILPEKTIYGQLGRGLNGPIYGYEGRLSKLRLGKFELSDVISVFPDTNSPAAKLSQSMMRQGNLGCEVMKRFKVIFNYNGQYVVLKPNKKMLKMPFERDMSGMKVKLKDKGGDELYVYAVERNSPAFDAGIKVGDEIISVDNYFFNELSISDVNEKLKSKEGKAVKLVIKRNYRFYVKEFTLKRML